MKKANDIPMSRIVKRIANNTGIARLEPYKHLYDFNCQLFNGEYNVYVERDLVDLFSVGGHADIDDAIDLVIEWIKRVNKFPTGATTISVEELNRVYGK